MELEIDFRAFDDALSRIADRMDTEVSIALDAVAAYGVKSMLETTNFNDRTGHLRGSFSRYGSGMATAEERVIGTDVPYGFFLEFGTKSASSRAAHSHIAAGYKASRSVKRAAGQWRIYPRHFVGDARTEVASMLRTEIADALTRATRG